MNKKIEIIANVSLIVIGLVLGIFFFISEKKDLSLILFSIALACILYQFLGGIGDGNSFQLGAIKFGGAAAILIGFMFFLKKIVFVPTPELYKLEISNKKWIPISIETGKIEPVTIKSGEQEIHFPNQSDSKYLENRKKHEYQISNINNSQFSIELKSTPQDTVGFIDINNFKTKGLYNKTVIAEDERRIQVFSLYPERENQNSSKKLINVSLPFNIEVFNTSRFSIEPFYKNLEVVKKTSYIIPFNEDEVYIVFLEQANSRDTIQTEQYSKWLVKKLKYKLEK
ncbi:hypothetical protein KAU11_09400 [Candidatus Babeliales bacterium]|nr:hypothetical protein [Candidatus Babeliales bacterium]